MAHGAAQSTLPLHVAKKKIPCLDAAGALVTPEAPNGVKLEMFIFDSFPVAKKVRAAPPRQPTNPQTSHPAPHRPHAASRFRRSSSPSRCRATSASLR